MFFFGNKGDHTLERPHLRECRPPASLPSSRGPFPRSWNPRNRSRYIKFQQNLACCPSGYRLAFNHSQALLSF